MTTQRIRLGSIVNCVHHRHPVMHARLAADLDRISRGRLILGLGIGWNAAEFAQLGLDFPPVPARQEALVEAVQIMRGVWGPEPFTFRGNHWWTDGGHIAPPPAQRPGPPLIIAGGGERVTLRQVASYADACNFGGAPTTGGARSVEEVRHKLEVLRGYCAKLGRPVESLLRTHFTSWLMLSGTEAGAQAKLDRYHPGGVSDQQKASRIAGTPETAIQFYQALADVGIDYFIVQIQDAADEETLRLLATAVAPHVRPSAASR
jgi:alkanesulfonate monooxygenase SsuD/methylene tetrahydromethanopterin reductase-like flavin-dependent oxidoreductase (luciferase family)